MIRSDGSFVFPEVVPGEYTLRAQVTGEGAMMALTVTRSVTGLALTTGRPGVARGRVVADAGVTAPLPTTQVSIVTAAWDTGFLGQGMPVRVKEDGTFEIAALHGLGMLRASAPGWYLKAVRHDGVDVTDTPLSFRYTADISGLEIVLSNRGTTFSGTVHSAKGAASRDYFLLVFPEDKAKWNWNSRFLQMARPDQSGRFRIEQLPPGDYLAVAVREAELDEWKDPEYLERIRAGATKVTLAEGEAKEVDLQLFTEEKR